MYNTYTIFIVHYIFKRWENNTHNIYIHIYSYHIHNPTYLLYFTTNLLIILPTLPIYK